MFALPVRREGSMSEDISFCQQALAERLHDGPLQELVALQLATANLIRSGALGTGRMRGRNRQSRAGRHR